MLFTRVQAAERSPPPTLPHSDKRVAVRGIQQAARWFPVRNGYALTDQDRKCRICVDLLHP